MSDLSLTGDTTVRDILRSHPQLFPVFESHGMCEDCKAAPPPVPLHHFSSKHGVPLERLIAELTHAAGA